MASRVVGGKRLIKELTKLADNLGLKKAESVLRRASGQALQPVLKEARNTVPVGTEIHTTYHGRVVGPGWAKRNLAIQTKIDRKRKVVRAMVGTRRDAGAFYITQFIELGTSKIEPNPWLETAFRRTRPEVIERFAHRMRRIIDREVAKAKR